MDNNIFVGSFYQEEFSFSQKEVEAFANLSRDCNPIHLDSEYAKNTIFKRPIIHGFLGGSIFSKIIGMHFPGEGTIYLNQNLKFMRPMYVDQKYTAIVKIASINYDKARLNLETEVLDAKGNKVIIGDALVQNPKIIAPSSF